VQEYTMADGRRIYLLGKGRLINLAAAEGHPASVMDMSFANQALCAEWMANNAKDLHKKVYAVPEDIAHEIARLKLKSMGVEIDVLAPEQEKYLASWDMGLPSPVFSPGAAQFGCLGAGRLTCRDYKTGAASEIGRGPFSVRLSALGLEAYGTDAGHASGLLGDVGRNGLGGEEHPGDGGHVPQGAGDSVRHVNDSSTRIRSTKTLCRWSKSRSVVRIGYPVTWAAAAIQTSFFPIVMPSLLL
jgi:hypothetical protein